MSNVTTVHKKDVAIEATKLIQKMYRHILNDGCIHCRHILNDDNNDKEAGKEPAPQQTAHNTHNRTTKLGSECYNE
jgi:hypothetical protein